MDEQKSFSNETRPDRESWQGRYTVRAQINYRGRHGKSGMMQVITYQPDMSLDEITALLDKEGYLAGAAGWNRLISQAKDTFSLPQAEALVAYLNSRPGTIATLNPAKKPLPVLMGASAIPSLPSFRDGIVYRLYTERGYNLPFKVEAINMKTFMYMARLYNEFQELNKHSE